MAGESYVIEFKVVGSTEGIEQATRQAQQQLSVIEQPVARAQQVLAKPFTVKIEAEQEALQRAISDIQSRLQRISSAKVGVDIDTAELLQKLGTITEQVRKSGGRVPLDVDVDTAVQKIQDISRRLQSLPSSQVPLDLDANETLQKIQDLSAKLPTLRGADIPVDLDVTA